jgi:hypothetical protein
MTAVSGSAGPPGADDLTARILGLGYYVVSLHADQPRNLAPYPSALPLARAFDALLPNVCNAGATLGARTPVGSADIAMILDWLD